MSAPLTIRPVAKGAHGPRPPVGRRRFTVRDSNGIAIGHGRTPQEAAAQARGRGAIAWIEERDRAYPFTVWHRVPVGVSS